MVNAATARASLAVLQEAGMHISQAAIREGFRSVQWPGRLEILGRAPFVVADSAHNGDSAHKLVTALKDHFGFRRLTMILGVSSDHATPELLAALFSSADRAIVTQARHPRAASPAWLGEKAQALGFEPELSATVPQALDMALADGGSDNVTAIVARRAAEAK